MKQLFKKVKEEYGLSVDSHRELRNDNDSLVVFLETNAGHFVGKSLYTSAKRQQSILCVEEYMRRRNILIPKTKRTKRKSPYMKWEGHPFVLQKWVPGTPCSLVSPEGIELAASCLGTIHAASLGFTCKSGDLSNGAKKWHHQYDEGLGALKRWYSSHKRSKDPKIQYICDHIPFFLTAGKKAQKKLAHSKYYAKLKRYPLHRHYLCHGDYHPKNLIVNGGHISVIDWEKVRYDYPSKDIIRLLSMIMKRQREWSEPMFAVLLKAYLRANPLTRKQMHLLYLDLAFPHNFGSFLRYRCYKRMNFSQVQFFLTGEASKTEFMLKQLKAHS
ncbi:CotS family spore coat protein [Brevibacillus sp. H7]|uniref:CotS family spore coat protein n=1 Tax=Brevibacillus sp. H7 TaxID=3349138 RepID=UPI0037FDB3D3